MIALVDYGAGNLTSVKKALAALDVRVSVPANAAELSEATGIIVPGVGHFSATAVLDEAWREAIRNRLAAGAWLLGICLGMQWLFEGSTEAPELQGLGALPGRCDRLRPAPVAVGEAPLKVPHVGWNALELTGSRPSRLLQGVPDGAQVYFTHSYVVPDSDATVAVTEHGQRFASAVERDRVFGVQFHPEKSGDIGLQVLRNFLARATGSDLHAVEANHRVS